MTVHIEMIGGNCPVQAEGTICGMPFYFRARGRRWTMGIGNDPTGISMGTRFPRVTDEWYAECTWGTGPFDAGWMPEEEARRLIEWCAAEYARSRQISPVAPVLDPAEASERANSERFPEPNLGPEGVA